MHLKNLDGLYSLYGQLETRVTRAAYRVPLAYHINCISNELETIWPSHFANGHEVRGELLPQVQHSHGVFILDGRQTAGLVDLFNFVYLVWQCLASIWIHLPMEVDVVFRQMKCETAACVANTLISFCLCLMFKGTWSCCWQCLATLQVDGHCLALA